MEPEKNAGWYWTSIEALRDPDTRFQPLFGASTKLLQHLDTLGDPYGLQLLSTPLYYPDIHPSHTVTKHTSHQRVRVGVGVFVYRSRDSNQFLMSRRLSPLGAGTWQLPGGHLEFGESFTECAIREVMEETGLRVDQVQVLSCTNDPMLSDGKHYVTVFTRAICVDADPQPQRMEPEKCDGWHWVTMQQLCAPHTELTPLFPPLQHYLLQTSMITLNK
jgi:8-oxo-dGTP diphosphatase